MAKVVERVYRGEGWRAGEGIDEALLVELADAEAVEEEERRCRGGGGGGSCNGKRYLQRRRREELR